MINTALRAVNKRLIMEIKVKYGVLIILINAWFAYYFQIYAISGSYLMLIDGPKVVFNKTFFLIVLMNIIKYQKFRIYINI